MSATLNRAAILAQLGGAQPATDGLLESFGKSVADMLGHDHKTQREDWYCTNLAAYMGERSAPVLRRLLDAESRAERYRIAWRRARTRALAVGGAADRAGARLGELLPALQEATFGLIGMQMERDAARRRVTELEERPLAWADRLDLKSLDNLLISLAQAADYEPMAGAIDQIHEVLAGFRAAAGKDTDDAHQAPAGESTQPADFFQPGRTYTDSNGYRAPELVTRFRVEYITRHPDRGHLRAIGWMKSGTPNAPWHGHFQDEGEFEGWTEVAEAGEPRG